MRLRLGRQLTDHSTLLAPYNTLMYLFSAVPPRPILDADAFPELAPLRENWQTFREEARELFEAGHIRKPEKYNDIAFNTFFKRGWKRFYLKWYDDFLPTAKELCPRSVELVRSIPSVNAALFALLPPGGRLGKHRDPFAGSLRYHLGLVTPNSDQCRIYIDGTPYAWRDGEHIVFDETYVHSARNDTDAYRIILFCDVTRPLRTPLVRGLNRFVARHMAKSTATQNVETEKVGVLNRVSGLVYRLKDFFIWVKERTNRRLYYLAKYVLLLGLLYFLFVVAF